MRAIQGIELSRRFYAEVVAPVAGARRSPTCAHAAALIGYGSELLGFDDAMSRDHNWGPRVQLYVAESDFAAARPTRWSTAFAEAAPASFLGVADRLGQPPASAAAMPAQRRPRTAWRSGRCEARGIAGCSARRRTAVRRHRLARPRRAAAARADRGRGVSRRRRRG